MAMGQAFGGLRGLRAALRFSLTLAAITCGLGITAAQSAPQRVVSVNLCTDQVAMLLAAPGQLVSVSHLARDPRSSVMAEAAADYPVNHGRAEEIYLLKPDLVLAGSYTSRPAMDLLARLGIKVARLPPVNSLEDAMVQLREIGGLLGQSARAEAVIAEFQADLAALPELSDRAAPLGVIYQPNGYTVGAGSLSDAIMTRAGLRNLGRDHGIVGGGTMPLETLVLAAPKVVITSTPYPAQSRSEEILRHPALQALQGQVRITETPGADWICGLPQMTRALMALIAAREAALDATGAME